MASRAPEPPKATKMDAPPAGKECAEARALAAHDRTNVLVRRTHEETSQMSPARLDAIARVLRRAARDDARLANDLRGAARLLVHLAEALRTGRAEMMPEPCPIAEMSHTSDEAVIVAHALLAAGVRDHSRHRH